MEYSELPIMAEIEDQPIAHDGSAFLIPVLPNDTLVRLQGMLQERYPDFIPSLPDTFHVTLCYMPGNDGFIPLLQRTDAFLINAESLMCFDTPDGFAIVCKVDSSEALFSLQSELHDQARMLDISLSNHSTPSEYQPHITLGYINSEIMPDVSGIDFYYSYVVDGIIYSDRNNNEYYIDFQQGLKSKEGLLDRILAGVKALFSTKPSFDFDTPTGFKLIGDQYWLAWYTNPYLDRDGEHFSLQSIHDDIDYMNRTKSYPELWRYHVGSPMPGGNKTRHGFGKWAFMSGKFACVVGVFDKTPLAEKFKTYYRNNPDQALSHGFFYFEKVGNIYTKYHTFEISTLPLEVAANPYTVFGSFSEVKMSEANDKAIADLRAILGDQMVDNILANGAKATDTLDTQGVAFKAKEDTPKEDMEDETKKPKEDSKAANELLITMANSLTTMVKSMSELTASVNATNQRMDTIETAMQATQEEKAKKEDKESLILDSRRKALIAEMEANHNVDSLEGRKKVHELSPAEGLLQSFDMANKNAK